MSVQPDETRSDHQDESELRRVMGPKLLLLFIVGDILGAGVYAVTGDIAGEVGGVAWLPFLVAFTVATAKATRKGNHAAPPTSATTWPVSA